jgi:signal transduction histidine kinase
LDVTILPISESTTTARKNGSQGIAGKCILMHVRWTGGLAMNQGLNSDFGKYPYLEDFSSIVERHEEAPPVRVKFRYDHPGVWQAAESMRKSVAAVTELLVQTAVEETRARFLADASLRLFTAADEEATLATLSQLFVPMLADGAIIFSMRGDTLQCRSVAHVDSAKESFVLALGSTFVNDAGNHIDWLEQVCRKGRPVGLSGQTLMDALARLSNDPQVLAAISVLEMGWMDGLPLVAQNRVLGAAFLFGASSRQELEVAGGELRQSLAHRAGLAVGNAQLHESARYSIRAREHLMAVASHDLRNSLSLAMMSLSALEMPLDGSSNLPPASRIALVRKGLGRMQRLVDDLLDFASIEAGQLSLSCSEQTARALMDEALETCSEAAARKGIRLAGQPPDGPCPLECDSFRILQVISNLIGNALKFTKAGGSVTVAAFDRGDNVEFSVTDTGCGITPTDLPHVFEAYRRAPRAASGGMGLGLSICKGIIESHGGKIWVDSRLGSGTTFSFCLPKHSPAHAKSDGG